MNTQKVRLNVTLPKDLVNMVDQMIDAKKRSQFIAEAIELKVKQTRKILIEKQLAEGYRACRRESIDISSEFETADLEGWDEY